MINPHLAQRGHTIQTAAAAAGHSAVPRSASTHRTNTVHEQLAAAAARAFAVRDQESLVLVLVLGAC
jgi:hypothetical protein